MSLFISATALHRETSRVVQTGLGQRGSGSDISISSFGSATTPAGTPADVSNRVGMSPSAAEYLSQLSPSMTGAYQGAVEAAGPTSSDPATSGDANLSSVLASLEADLADLVSGLGANGAGAIAAGRDPAPPRTNFHDLLQTLDANSAGNPSALTGTRLG